MARSDVYPKRRSVGYGHVGGQSDTLQTLTEKRPPYSPTQRQVAGGLNPSDTENGISPTDPTHP